MEREPPPVGREGEPPPVRLVSSVRHAQPGSACQATHIAHKSSGAQSVCGSAGVRQQDQVVWHRHHHVALGQRPERDNPAQRAKGAQRHAAQLHAVVLQPGEVRRVSVRTHL